MRVAEYFRRTPGAMKRASASRDKRHGRLAVFRFPGFEIIFHDEHVAIRPGETVQIRNCGTRRSPKRTAVAFENDSRKVFKSGHSPLLQPRNQSLERALASVRADDVDAIFQVKIGPFRSVRP